MLKILFNGYKILVNVIDFCFPLDRIKSRLQNLLIVWFLKKLLIVAFWVKEIYFSLLNFSLR